MAKKPKTESLALEDLGNLDDASHDELLTLRGRLITDVDCIHRDSAQLAQRIKALNEERLRLQHRLALRAKALRAIKHALNQRGAKHWSESSSMRGVQSTAPRKRSAPHALRGTT